MINPKHALCAMDIGIFVQNFIGGTLTKLICFEPKKFERLKDSNLRNSLAKLFKTVNASTEYGSSGTRDVSLSFPYQDYQIHFIVFETRRMEGAIELFKLNQLPYASFPCTGGGSLKYKKMFRDQLGIELVHKDELQSLLHGLAFILASEHGELFYYSNPSKKNMKSEKSIYEPKDIYPYIVVNIGSGVSILRVDGPGKFERVSGTSLGGGTFIGLFRMMTGCSDFVEAMNLAQKGENDNVDMLVADIYGGDYPQFGLKGDIVASAFGKINMMRHEEEKEENMKFKKSDIARSLVNAIGTNIAQIAFLCAQNQKVKIDKIIFAGNFLRQNEIARLILAYSIHYWSKGDMKALFLKHEGFLGAIGSFFI